MPNDGEQRLHVEMGAGTGVRAGTGKWGAEGLSPLQRMADGRSLSKTGCRKDL